MPTTRRTALALFLVVAIAYQVPLVYDLLYKPFFNWAPGIDVASTTLLPLSLLERGDWTLDQFGDFYRQYYRDPYFIATVNGRTVSRFPVAGAVLALPFYGVPLATGWIADSGHTWLPYPWTAFMVAKGAAGLDRRAGSPRVLFLCARADRRGAQRRPGARLCVWDERVVDGLSGNVAADAESLAPTSRRLVCFARAPQGFARSGAGRVVSCRPPPSSARNNALPALIFTVLRPDRTPRGAVALDRLGDSAGVARGDLQRRLQRRTVGFWISGRLDASDGSAPARRTRRVAVEPEPRLVDLFALSPLCSLRTRNG